MKKHNEILNVVFEEKLAIFLSKYKLGVQNITYEHPAKGGGHYGKISIDVVFHGPEHKELTDADFTKG